MSEVAVENDVQQQIADLAYTILSETSEKGLNPNVVFNGISAALTSLLISFTIGSNSELNLETLGKNFDNFVTSLDQNIRDTIDKLKVSSPEIEESQASAIITSV